MTVKTLYRYIREDGGITISPSKPNKEYTELYRLIADEVKILVKENHEPTCCIDVDSTDGWYEVEDTRGENTDALYVIKENAE